MIVLAGGDLVLPDRVLSSASLVIDGNRVGAVDPRSRVDPAGARIIEVGNCYVVPGFVDVHVHGVEGIDTLDAGAAVEEMARRLPRYGVTAFCPTTVACPPHELRSVLSQVATARAQLPRSAARVLPAHLESNFINPDYRGAQPAECLRLPGGGSAPRTRREESSNFSTDDILEVIADAGPAVGIVTLAPELPGGIELVRTLVSAGHRVSLGHSGANLAEAMSAIDAGARHATHLFNCMTPLHHRALGLAGAVMAHDEVAAELICDGYHVHPAIGRIAIRSKGVSRVMAITDGTAGSGLPIGASTTLGGQRIRVTEHAAVLDDGTIAGSTLTMDRAFRTIVSVFGFSVIEAAMLCSTTPAQEMGLAGLGAIARDAYADITILDRSFRVLRTFIAGREVYVKDGGK